MSSKLADSVQLDFEQIKQIIPQRFPFLMLDRVVELEPGVRAVGVKNLTGNEWFYQGHFPKKAITPGAMICEAIAQTGIVFFHINSASRNLFQNDGENQKSTSSPGITGFTAEESPGRANARDVTYLLGSLKIRFIEPVWPGDQLRIEVTPIKLTASAGILNAEVRVADRIVAKGEFGLAVKENSAF